MPKPENEQNLPVNEDEEKNNINDEKLEEEIINDKNQNPEQNLKQNLFNKNNKNPLIKLRYHNSGIQLIFDNLTSDFSYFYKHSYDETQKEFIFYQLKEKLKTTTFHSKLNNKENLTIKNVIQDYFIYFLTKNEDIKDQTKNFENKKALIENICDIKFKFSKKNENDLYTEEEFLSLFIWCNIFYNELNEFLFCAQFFNEKKNLIGIDMFEEMNNLLIQDFNEKEEESKNEYALKKTITVIFRIFIEQSTKKPELVKYFKNTIQFLSNINTKYNLICKELYSFIQISHIFELYEKIFNSNEKEKLHKLKTIFNNYKEIRYLYKSDEESNGKKIEKYLLFFRFIRNDLVDNIYDFNKLCVKILLQEYYKYEANDNFIFIVMNLLTNYDYNLIENSQIIFHEILSKYVTQKNIFIEKINNPENDYFLNIIKDTEEYIKSKYLGQILLEVFETKINSYFMSHSNKMNKMISYADLKDEQLNQILISNNLEKLKQCIEFLEDPNGELSNERFIPNIFYCAYIKTYLYHFISYIFYHKEKVNANDETINEKVVKIIRGEDEKDKTSKVRKIIEIYTFRILYYFLDKNFENFKNYNFDEKGLTYRNLFKDEDSFDDAIPKLFDFCGRTIEDFINIPDATPRESYDEQNFYSHSFLSIRAVSRASKKNNSLSSDDFKKIWDYFKEKLKSKKMYIGLKSEDITLNYFLLDDLIDNLYEIFNNNSDIEFNEKTMGIIIYVLRICFHTFTIEEGFQSNFYSKILNPKMEKQQILDFLNENFIPGGPRGNKNFQKVDFNNFINITAIDLGEQEGKIEALTIAVLKFIFYCHLFFLVVMKKLDKNKFQENYSVNEDYSCEKIIVKLWDKLDELIPGTEINKVEIFLNRVNKEMINVLKDCNELTEENQRNIFEKSFNDFIINCVDDYKYFKLIYFSKTMRAIIQENNYPKAYREKDYPFISYFVFTHYPDMNKIKKKILDEKNENSSDTLFVKQLMNFDDEENENFKEDIFFKFIILNIYINCLSLMPIHSSGIFYISSDLILKIKKFLKAKKFDFIEIFKKEGKDKLSYSDILSIFSIFSALVKKTQLEMQPSDNNYFSSLIKSQNNFLELAIKNIKDKNEYIYKNIRRKKNFLESNNNENLIFEINKISNYESYIYLISKYIYKDIFTSDKDKSSNYVVIERTIEYNKYQNFDIEMVDLENELISILLTNKKLYKDSDQFNNVLVPFELFKGNNKNLLSSFLKIYKNSEEILDIDLYNTFINDILQKDENIINLYIDNWISGKINLRILLSNENLEFLSDKKEKITSEIKINKKYLENKIYENNAKADFIIQNYFVFQKVILYLTKNIIDDEELTLYEILTNLPQIINISNYSLYYFEKHPEFKLKHLFSLYELTEKVLYNYILSFVNKEYFTDISDECKDEIISYFDENENDIENTIFTKNQLINALRKYISRYLTTSCIQNNNDINDYYQGRYFVQKELLLFDELNKADLWPKEIYEK